MPAMDYSRVAELYDLYVQTQIDVPFFLQEAQGCQRVLELTSGTGRLSVPLLEAGVPLTCLDNSPEMLAVLRRKLRERGLSAPIHEMDASDFSLNERFDLAVIPFNSFAEFVEPAVHQKALETIAAHLSDDGRLICTLHNPAVRLKTVDGQVHERGRFALPDGQGTLVLSSQERYDPDACLVTGTQFYDLYDADGALQPKQQVEIEFYLHSHDTFESLADSQGYRVETLYGDYERHAFDAAKSPFMIWILTRFQDDGNMDGDR
jgi:SAM-dependent methyltransferase